VAGRKVFTSGEILTAADVNSFLMDQSVMVFADSSARSSAIPSPSEGMVTYVEDANRVEVFDGSAFGPIGGILQVVSTTKTDTFTASLAQGTETAITGLSASITPSSTSSKILVQVAISSGATNDNVSQFYTLFRDSTALGEGDAAGSRQTVTAFSPQGVSVEQFVNSSINFLDSPASASSLTYLVKISHARSVTNSVFINRSSVDSDSNFISRASSTITLMEVAV